MSSPIHNNENLDQSDPKAIVRAILTTCELSQRRYVYTQNFMVS